MLGNLLETAAAIDPSRILLRTDDGEPISTESLLSRASTLAQLLKDQQAAHCVYLGVNGPSMPIALFASILAGVPFAPLNYRLAPAQIEKLLTRLDHPFLISDTPQGSLTNSLTIAQVQQLGEGDGLAPDAEISHDGDTIAVILFTSGTTAEPKAVPLRHENLASYLLNSIELMGAAPDEATLITVPPYHVAAIGATLSNVLGGRRIAYLPNFTPEAWIETVREHAVTSAMLVPTMLSRIVESLGGDTVAGLALRNLAYGGSRMNPELLRRALLSFPEVGFTNAYGLTETSSTIAILGPDDHRSALDPSADEAVRARLASVGQPIPGVELQVRDDDGSPLAAGSSGRLWVRGPQISGEYVGKGSQLDAEGWFDTQDSAYLDTDGFLFVLGRADDTIIRGAENIAPAEIEDVIAAHEAVAAVSVVGLPDPEWGQRTAAIVVRRANGQCDAEELREWVRGTLRSSRTPDEVHFIAELPYGPTGKVLTRQLVEQFTASAENSTGAHMTEEGVKR